MSVLFTDGEGTLSGGTVRDTCSSSASISDEQAGNLYGETQASSGLSLRFSISGDTAYILTVNGTFTGTMATGAGTTGMYRLVGLSQAGDAVSVIARFNSRQDGGGLSVSDSVVLPPGGPYRLDIGHTCNAVAIGFAGSNTAQSSLDFTFTFAPAE